MGRQPPKLQEQVCALICTCFSERHLKTSKNVFWGGVCVCEEGWCGGGSNSPRVCSPRSGLTKQTLDVEPHAAHVQAAHILVWPHGPWMCSPCTYRHAVHAAYAVHRHAAHAACAVHAHLGMQLMSWYDHTNHKPHTKPACTHTHPHPHAASRAAGQQTRRSGRPVRQGRRRLLPRGPEGRGAHSSLHGRRLLGANAP